MSSPFWEGKRVLLTGHTGFKGAWLALWLKKLGAEITGLALDPPTQPNLYEAARVADGMTSVLGDIRDLNLVVDTMRGATPEIVLHLAAQSLVRVSYEQPIETYATNVLGTAHVLEAMRVVGGVAAAVIVTTDKCYENEELDHAFREAEPLGGYDPYSSSKACAEIVTAAYRRSYFGAKGAPRVASARAGNVIGGGDWARERLVPDLMRAFTTGQPAIIRNPLAIRPWQHVLEPLAGYLSLAEALCSEGDFTGAWNFGPNAEDVRNVQWVADELVGRWGNGAAWERDPSAHPHEAMSLRLDCTKAKERLGWQPHITLREALDSIVRWYHAYHVSAANASELCEEELDRYMTGGIWQLA